MFKRLIETIRVFTTRGKYEQFKRQLERIDPSSLKERKIQLDIEREVKRQAKELAKKYGLPPGVVYRALLRLGPQLEDLLTTLQQRGLSKKDIVTVLEAVGEGASVEQIKL